MDDCLYQFESKRSDINWQANASGVLFNWSTLLSLLRRKSLSFSVLFLITRIFYLGSILCVCLCIRTISSTIILCFISYSSQSMSSSSNCPSNPSGINYELSYIQYLVGILPLWLNIETVLVMRTRKFS